MYFKGGTKQGNQTTPLDTLNSFVNFNDFCALLTGCELTPLATHEVFMKCNVNGSGSINIVDFLLALLQIFLPFTNVDEYEVVTKIIFSLFDLNGANRIHRDVLNNCHILVS